MTEKAGRIYPLIPAIYRQRDARLGHPLKALCKVLDIQYEALREDVGGLYDQWFIETCSQWVVPYIGDLLGVGGINTTVANVATQRTRVANTVGYRGRKGTAAVLASACADATGWPALPVEYFQRVITTLDVGAVEFTGGVADNLRPSTINVSSPSSLEYLDGPFSTVTRTVAVGAIDKPKVHLSGSTPEYYNLPNLGLFLWRIHAFPIAATDPGTDANQTYYTFHPGGIDTPLIQLPVDRTSPWVPPAPENMPLSITRSLLAAWVEIWRLAKATAFTASQLSGLPNIGFSIVVKGLALSPADIYVPVQTGDVLADPTSLFAVAPKGPYAVVDPERGRFTVHNAGSDAPVITTDWTWGQPGSIGGGGYDRQSSMVIPEPQTQVVLVSQKNARSTGDPVVFDSLGHAYQTFAQESTNDAPINVLVLILDSCTYASFAVGLRNQDKIVIQAVDGVRPSFAKDDSGNSLSFQVTGRASVTLSGLFLEGTLKLSGDLDVTVLDSTIAPPVPQVSVPAIFWHNLPADSCHDSASYSESTLTALRCILGPIVMCRHAKASIAQSIVDAAGGRAIGGAEEHAGPILNLAFVSILGSVFAVAIDEARDAIITGGAEAYRVSREVLKNELFALTIFAEPSGTARGRASVWSRQSRLPILPFVSARYGNPNYCQLQLEAGETLLRGGVGGAEMGAYHTLASGQRLANIAPILQEYAPFGLDTGVFVMGQGPVPIVLKSSATHSPSRGEADQK